MSSRFIYIFAVLLLPLIRAFVIELHGDEWLLANHFDHAAAFVAMLRNSVPFIDYMGSWALLVFVAAVMLFWMTEEDATNIARQFWLLPIAYVPFSIVGMILETAQFHFSYLYVHPLIILPFGYLYMSLWALLIWLLGKAHIVQ